MNLTKSAVVLAAIFLLTYSLFAQTYPNGLNEDSVNPEADKAFILEANKRMQVIRDSLNRPTVALVLSGGGAKGAAEVGAMKYLEELGIPVDMVMGTSIGGLVGGLYALGYCPDDMRELFMTQDWSKTLTDNVSDKYVPYAIKEFDSRAFVSLKLGKSQSLAQTILIPAGYAYGFNVNNLFSSMAVGYSGDISFLDLPIPYTCVAADMVSCKAYNWVGGSITDAMRSTMSIPGLFAPIKTKGMVLVDGGVRNNFPADLAKAMGADIIIGIELSDSRPDYDGVNHLGNLVQQFISMLGREVLDNNVGLADVIIKPNLDGFNMLSFSAAAVDTMVHRGMQAAKIKEKELLAIKDKIGNSQVIRPKAKATDISKQSVYISSISFDGLNDDESLMMFDIIDIDIKKPVDKTILDDAMCALQASGFFSEVKYALEGPEEPYNLVFKCVLAPVNKFGFGLRGDTVEGVSLYTYYGINANKLLGSKLSFEAKLSHNLRAKVKYTYVSHDFPAINLEASFHNLNHQYGIVYSTGRYSTHYQSHKESIYLSDVRWKKYNFKLGFQNWSMHQVGNDYFDDILDISEVDYLGAFAEGHFYSYNDAYFPTKGSNITLLARYDFEQLGHKDTFKPTARIELSQRTIIPIGSKFALIPSFIGVANIFPAENSEWSYLHAFANYIGGTMDKRVHRNHIPFFGYSRAVICSHYVLTGTMECRYNPFDKFYASLLAGHFTTSDSLKTIYDPNNCLQVYAFGTEFSYKSLLGPIKLNIHWNNSTAWGAVFSIGYDF